MQHPIAMFLARMPAFTIWIAKAIRRLDKGFADIASHIKSPAVIPRKPGDGVYYGVSLVFSHC